MIILYVLLVWVYSHLLEYSIHRWILHPFGKRKTSILSFHWRDHHRLARKTNMQDGFGYKETILLALLVLLHYPIVFFSVWAFIVLILSAIEYSYKHNKAHKSPAWAIKNVPWHYAHHMGKNQDMNWGVRSDWVDRLFGTRVDLNGNPI